MRENFYKTQHQWYFTPAKSDKMYPEILGACWKCWMEEADFFHIWWDCKRVRRYWRKIHSELQRTIGVNISFKLSLFLLSDLKAIGLGKVNVLGNNVLCFHFTVLARLI